MGNYPFSPVAGDLTLPVPIADGGTGQATAAAAFAALAPLTTEGDLLYESAAPAPARLPVGSAGQVLGVSGGAPAWGMGMTLLASTPASGTALANGTQTILTWTAPNDGNMHRFALTSVVHVTSAETGGGLQLQWKLPDGTADTNGLYAGGSGTGIQINPGGGVFMQLVEPGTTVNFVQTSALTAGAATVWAELWGS